MDLLPTSLKTLKLQDDKPGSIRNVQIMSDDRGDDCTRTAVVLGMPTTYCVLLIDSPTKAAFEFLVFQRP